MTTMQVYGLDLEIALISWAVIIITTIATV